MNRNDIVSFLKNLRPFRSIHFLLMIFFGVFFSYKFDVIKLILGFISIFFSWQFSISLNDIFDVEIDKISNPDRPYVKGAINKKKYILISIILAAISIITVLFMSFISLIFISFYIFLGYIYSAPPFRFRKYIFGIFIIGISSSLAYFSGLFACINIIDLTLTQLLIGILILAAFSMGTVVKDYKDYEGDKNANVNTIFTKYGLEKGSKITSILLLFTFLLPFILIQHLFDFIIIIPMCIIVVILFNYKKIKRKTQITMIIYFIEIIYVFLRITLIITY